MKKKPYIRYMILGILATLMVGCIIRIAMPNREWNYTGSYTFAEGESYTEEPVFEHISLGTGVYRVELVTSAIFSFMWRWDDFLAALLYLSDPLKYPVSYALKMFSDPTAGSDWGAMFAMATLSLIPIFVIFLTMQKYLVEGIASTGIKG